VSCDIAAPFLIFFIPTMLVVFSIVCTQVAQKIVSTMLNGKAVPQGELYLARKAGFGNLANIFDRLNLCFRPVSKNGEGKGMPLSLHRTQVSRNINTTGDLIFKEKRKIIQESLHCSPFLDESTTVGMGTRPVYAGAMATTKDFLWACFFVGQSDTSGCDGGQTYFNTVKEIYVNAGLWGKFRAIGTDGCAAMRSTPEYAGVDAHSTQGESFVAYVKRDVAPDRDPFAFHSALHIASLAVGDAVKVLPSWWIKVRGCGVTEILSRPLSCVDSHTHLSLHLLAH
jgi:hypothetical protein